MNLSSVRGRLDSFEECILISCSRRARDPLDLHQRAVGSPLTLLNFAPPHAEDKRAQGKRTASHASPRPKERDSDFNEVAALVPTGKQMSATIVSNKPP